MEFSFYLIKYVILSELLLVKSDIWIRIPFDFSHFDSNCELIELFPVDRFRIGLDISHSLVPYDQVKQRHLYIGYFRSNKIISHRKHQQIRKNEKNVFVTAKYYIKSIEAKSQQVLKITDLTI